MSLPRLFRAVSVAVSLAALVASGVAVLLSDLDRGLRDFPREIPDYVPLWMDEEIDLP